METIASIEHHIDWDTLFDETIPCEIEHGDPHEAQWYAAFGCTNCDEWNTTAVCDEARRMLEAEFDELTHCPCGIADVPFRNFFHGFTPVRG